MSYDEVYDSIRKLQAAVETHERENAVHRMNAAELWARVQQLEEELAKAKATVERQEKLLQDRLRIIKDLQQQRDSLRSKNAELDVRIATLGRKTSAGSCNSPVISSKRSSYSSNSSEDTNSTTPSEPSTPKSSLPPIPMNEVSHADSDTDTEEIDEASTVSSGSGCVGATHAIESSAVHFPSSSAAVVIPPSQSPRSRSAHNGASPATATREVRAAATNETTKLSPHGLQTKPKSALSSSQHHQLRRNGHASSQDAPFSAPGTVNGIATNASRNQCLVRTPTAGSCDDVPSNRAAAATQDSQQQQQQQQRQTSSDSSPRFENKPYFTSGEQSPSYQQASDGQVRATGSSSATSGRRGGEEAITPSPHGDLSRPDQRSALDGPTSSVKSQEKVPMQASTENTSPDLVCSQLQPGEEEAPTQFSAASLISATLDTGLPGKGAPDRVSRGEAPKQASGEEAPRQMSGEEAPGQISGDEVPKQVSGEEALRQISAEEAPKLVSGEESPMQMSGEDPPKTDLNLNSRPNSVEKTTESKDEIPKQLTWAKHQDCTGTTSESRSNGCSTQATSRPFNRCQSEEFILLVPKDTSDDLALTIIKEDNQVDDGLTERRKRTNTYSPASKQLVGRRTPKEIKKAENKNTNQQLKVVTMRKDVSAALKYLSPDMEAKIYDRICKSLGAKYGSLERASEAAVTIQKTYRGYKLRRHFEEMRKEGPSAIRKRTATVRDKSRKLSIKNRPMKSHEEIARVQETVDKINNRRHSPGRSRASLKRREFDDETPPPLPPPLHPDLLPLEEGVSAGHPRVTKSLSVGDSTGACGGEASTGPLSLMHTVQLTISPAESDASSTDGRNSSNFNIPTSQSADLSSLHRLSVFSRQSAGASMEEGRAGSLSQQMSAADVKKCVNIGVYQFNRKPTCGLQYLVTAGVLQDSPESVATFLREQFDLSKVKIGEFLGEISMDFNMAVLEHLVASVDLKDKPIDEALREFQKLFRMPGEAQKIDRIMQIFAAEFVKVNKEVLETEDAAYVLSFSIMMLHTSLHNPSVKQRTSKEQWLKMNRGLNNGSDFPRHMLLEIYNRIQKTEFETARDHTQKVIEIQQQLEGSDIRDLVAPHRWFIEEVVVYELDDINHWFKSNKHQRHLLIFSDLVIITKKTKNHFQCKKSFSLFNAIVMPFTTTPEQSLSKSHKHGIQVRDLFDKTMLLQCACETPDESAILMNKLTNAITMLKELEKERIEMLGSSVEMRRCSTTTSTEMAGEIMVAHCRPSTRATRGVRRNSLDSAFVPLIELAEVPKPNVAKSMEDLSRLPSCSPNSIRNAGESLPTNSPRWLSVIESSHAPRSPSDGNLVGNTREPLRATKSSSPDMDREARPVERTKSESSNKKTRVVKRNKTEKKGNKKKK